MLDQETQDIVPEHQETEQCCTFITRGASIEQSLRMVVDPIVREQLRPSLYMSRLRAAIVAAMQPGVLTKEQAKELLKYVEEDPRNGN